MCSALLQSARKTVTKLTVADIDTMSMVLIVGICIYLNETMTQVNTYSHVFSLLILAI